MKSSTRMREKITMESCRGFVPRRPLRHALGCLLFLAISFAGFAATQNTSSVPKLPANFYRLSGPDAVVPMPVTVMDPNPESVRLRFSDPPLEFGKVTLKGTDFQTVRLSGEASTLDPGAPDLPAVNRMVMIANTGNVKLAVLNTSYTESDLPLDISPVQMLEGDTGYPADGYSAPLPEIYGKDEWYPASVAEISDPATLRDVRFVAVRVYPVQVNPVTKKMRVYSTIDVQVTRAPGVGQNEIHITPTSISPDFKRLYSEFENFGGSALDALPVLPGKYLVICPNVANAITQAQNLVNWRRRLGFDASYVTTSTTGSSASSIRSYITNFYTSSNGQLEAVCLLGDVTGTYAIATGTTWSGGYTGEYDNYYGKLANNAGPNPDPVPDIAIGRLSAADDNSLASIVSKTINYESNPYMGSTSWFTHGWCAAGTAMIPSNVSTKRYTQSIMLQHGLNPVDWSVFPSSVTTTDLNNHLQAGLSVFNDRMSWINEMSNSTVDGITASPMLPLVMVITCGTGDFDGDALSEHWLRPNGQTPANPKGAIGCVGVASSHTSVPYNNIVDAGAMYGLYVLDIQSQGMALVAGKLELYRNYHIPRPTETEAFADWNNLMGDPTVSIWRHRPVVANVTRPATITRGTNNVSVTVTNSETSQPVSDAFVCLLKGTETFARGYTNVSGQINLPCSTATTGYMQVTINKEDIKTYVDSIQVTSGTSTLALNSLTVDDDGAGGTIGNSDHILNPGETIDLVVNLTNTGTSGSITGISGTLTTSSPGIQITSATSAYANIAAGGNANPTTPFRIVVTSVFDQEPSTFFLNLTSSAGTQTVRLDLTPRAPDMLYLSQTFSGPGGNVDPGEQGDFTVTIRNTGGRPMSSANGILRSLDPYIQVTDSMGTFGTIATNATGTNTGNPFHIVASAGAFAGHRTVMQLVLYDANGWRDSTVFDSLHFYQSDTTLYTPNAANFFVKIGTQATTTPTGPDAHGYYAYDNTETQPLNSGSIYQWVEIYGAGGTSLGFNDQSEDGDQSSVLDLSFNFTFYGQSFNQITVCSNGWLAFGSTTQTDYRNYRMGSPLGPPNIVAAYWDDLKTYGSANNAYYYYNPTEHYYCVEWRSLTLWTSVSEVFEVLLYDPAYYPSASGDGKIKVQYNTVNISPNQDNSGTDNLYCTVGIENGDHSQGLDYSYWNAYSPGSSTLAANRAIMYTTDGNGGLIPSLAVTQPRGDEQWYVGQNYTILWNSTALLGNVNISLNRTYPTGGWETIVSNTANDGSESWIPAGPVSAHARIRIISVNNPTVGDTCAADFSIILPTVTITQPVGGEVIPSGQHYDISWLSMGLGSARVELNRSYPSASWELLSASAPGDLDWTVTGPPTNTARIRVTGISVPTVGDTSDANFTIGMAPVITYSPRCDAPVGPVQFVAKVTDDVPGFTTKVFYRTVGAVSYDSLALTSSGFPNEFAGTTPTLTTGRYEYYLRATDTQLLSTYAPTSGTNVFDVGAIGANWIAYDDSVAEGYNWTDGPDYRWAVKFDPGTYPYALTAGQFAICPTHPSSVHQTVVFDVRLADGPGGLPGTLVFTDTTGSGAALTGSPTGASWAKVVTRAAGQALQLNGPFYLSVGNREPRTNPAAFARDTTSARNHLSYLYDACAHTWYNEDAGTGNTRAGDRMIRASGFPLSPLTVVIARADSADYINALLTWTSVGAPYYHIYSASAVGGPFDTLVGSITGPAAGQAVNYTDRNAINQAIKKFYRVYASDVP
jgi:hypothetical protein